MRRREAARFGRFVIDSGSVQATAGDRQVQLTPTEFQRLRKKLEDAIVTDVTIETSRGFGYRLVDAARGR